MLHDVGTIDKALADHLPITRPRMDVADYYAAECRAPTSVTERTCNDCSVIAGQDDVDSTTRTMEFTLLNESAIPGDTPLILVVLGLDAREGDAAGRSHRHDFRETSGEKHSADNPKKETIFLAASSDASTTAARLTTLSASGGVIDGPSRVEVARISELRERDFEVLTKVLDADAAENPPAENGIAIDRVPELVRRAGLTLSDELYQNL
ncbi:hypothetical protein GQ600_18315 [Phytophthora cactorum]|nr:hypothetical protein GQ600_18315 [Phytophthora cactorum]